jgi:type IV pilus assembly protein PilA
MALAAVTPERTAVIASSSNLSSRDASRSIVRRARVVREQDGFTLMELLTALLIIGILAAIAIPSFVGQTSRADDSAAKTQIGTLATTMKTFAMQNDGSYEGATLAKLAAIEPTLRDKTTAIAQEVVNPTSTGFELESKAVGSKHVYKLTDVDGSITRSCSPVDAGGCTSGSW